MATEIKTIYKADNSNTSNNYIPIWHKYSLSVDEAAQYFGIGESRIYRIISDNQGADFILEVGTHVKIKRKAFTKFLDATNSV